MKVINKVNMSIYEADVTTDDIATLNRNGCEVYIADGELIIEERGTDESN